MSDATPKSVYGPGDWRGEPARDLGAHRRDERAEERRPVVVEILAVVAVELAGVALRDDPADAKKTMPVARIAPSTP